MHTLSFFVSTSITAHSLLLTLCLDSSEWSGGGKTLENFLGALDNDLAEHYRIDQWNSGTIGKGHNCPDPYGPKSLN